MTSDEIEFMAECEHRGACGRLVTMHAISHADPFDWCMCAACPHHEGHPRENARLEFENAKLRKDVDRLIQAVEDLHDVSLEDRLVQMENENAKLRELVRFIMHQCNDGNPRCDECIGWNDGECVALLRMRELGVEVES